MKLDKQVEIIKEESPMKIQSSPIKNNSHLKEDKSELDKSNENPLSEYMSGTNLADLMFLQDKNLLGTK